MKIIGITGKARTGKDTLARIICEQVDGAIQMSFADPIRNFVADLIHTSPKALSHDDVKDLPLDWLNGVSPRMMMQTLGTEWGRHMISSDIWVAVLRRKLDVAFGLGTPLVVIPDVRFENEAAMIRRQGGLLVHLFRDGARAVNSHISEKGVEWVLGDRRVLNAGTIEDLREESERLVAWARQGDDA